MHRTVASMMAQSREPLSLSTLSTRRGSRVVLAFNRSRPFPLWAAKIATSPEASQSLAREYRAIETLGPWARQLNVPVVLAWDEADPVCLVTSGVSGNTHPFALTVETGRAADARRLQMAVEWLRLLRESVPVDIARRAARIPGIDDDLMDLEKTAHALELPELAELCHLLREPGRPPVLTASHGDYWSGNILFSHGRGGERAGVIDFGAFGARDRFHDLLSLFTTCSYVVDRKVQVGVSAARFFHLFFAETAGARFIRDSLQELRPSDGELRRAFYLFVANSLRTKAERYRESWRQIVRQLASHGFPEPWSRSVSVC